MQNDKYCHADTHQIAGSHYKSDIQPWNAMKAWFPAEGYKYFLIGNAIKYLSRAGKKNGLFKEDILKARHYLDKLLDEIDE